MRLLVIRPQPGADATAARIDVLGYTAVLMPLFQVRPLPWELPPPENYDALMISSGNAVRHAGNGLNRLRDLPVFAVGAATMKAAEKAGLTIAFVGQTDVEALVRAASQRGHTRLLWLAGEDRTAFTAADDVHLDTLPVYKSEALPAPAGFDTVVRGADVVLLHSPRAARYFAELCDEHAFDRGQIAIAALSPQIGESAGPYWKRTLVAHEPNDAALLSQVQSYFTNGDRDP